MMQKLAFLGLVTAASAAMPNPIKVTCNEDNTIDVTIDYDKRAEVLEFSYGSCNATNGRHNLTQNVNYGWDFQLDVDACGMDGRLRTLDYNQTAFMRVGRKDGNFELTMATFDIDGYCSFTESYKVKFDYGTLDAEAHQFESAGGLVNISFALQAYNENYTNAVNHSNVAGQKIYLGLTIISDGFDFANMTDKSTFTTTGKAFAPQSCVVSDENNTNYTLFANDEDRCDNDAVDFSIGYDDAQNMWQFEHILFLLGNYRKSNLALECDVVVCDMQEIFNDCTKVFRNCAM